ncbi:hypothetical protein SBRCBS47491_009863 [Sporothrix bragantina]|uniref:Uncharacterized protein n=1 Tax=Sporothrix bragantina TaxID=671064 RepID=A0ABP0CY75_9PEZI
MGYATAVLLASRGAKVSIADINAAGLESVKAEIEGAAGAAMITQCDIRDSSAVRKWISATVEAWGPLDGVANIGAVIGRQIMRDTVAEIEEEDWDFVIDPTPLPACPPPCLLGMGVPNTTDQRIQFALLVRPAGPKRPVQTLPIAHVVTHRSSSNASAPAAAESSVPRSG